MTPPPSYKVLEMLLAFLLREYPTRFALEERGAVVATRADGLYDRRFVLVDWAKQPLKLVGMLVQEDFYLLEEQDVAAEGGALPPLPNDVHNLPGSLSTADNLARGHRDYDGHDHAEEHPSGKQHIFMSACSCFSFEAVPRHRKSMASIGLGREHCRSCYTTAHPL